MNANSLWFGSEEDFGGMIVAGDCQHTAQRRGAVEIGVLERIARAVDAGGFPVPHAEHTIDLPPREQIHKLRTGDGRGAQILIEARFETDAVPFEMGFRPEKLLIEPAQGRAAIARNKTARVVARCPVRPALVDQ